MIEEVDIVSIVGRVVMIKVFFEGVLFVKFIFLSDFFFIGL